MIVHIDDSFLDSVDDKPIDDIFTICRILENCHYITVSNDVLEALNFLVEEHVNPGLKSIYYAARNYINPPKKLQRYLTKVEWSRIDERTKRVLFFKPSELLVENAPYEWNTYKKIISEYIQDDEYGDIFAYIHQMIQINGLVPSNAGGIQTIPSMIELKDNGEYQGLFRLKSCTIMDRDTEDNSGFSQNNNRLFVFFAGKTYDQVVDEDVYKLDFGKSYIWHVWYKRAIENYFPIEEYEKLGVDMSEARSCADYDYFKHITKGKRQGLYDKKMMIDIGKSATYESLTSRLRTFTVNEKDYNEMQLLLLKIAKIV